VNPPDHPTPRTNAIAHRGYPEPAYIVEMTDLARTLERELTETERLRFGADADRRRLRAEVERLKGALALGQQNCDDAYDDLREERDDAIARAEKAEAAFADPHTLHAHCLRTLTEGQIAHLFGERMTEIVNRAEKAEAALAFIAENGGTKHETECGTINCNGLWCAEQARAAMKAEAECLEQARLLGMSGEREADLLGKIERLNRVIERASVQFFHEGSDGETAAKMLTVLNEAK